MAFSRCSFVYLTVCIFFLFLDTLPLQAGCFSLILFNLKPVEHKTLKHNLNLRASHPEWTCVPHLRDASLKCGTHEWMRPFRVGRMRLFRYRGSPSFKGHNSTIVAGIIISMQPPHRAGPRLSVHVGYTSFEPP